MTGLECFAQSFLRPAPMSSSANTAFTRKPGYNLGLTWLWLGSKTAESVWAERLMLTAARCGGSR
jgi:hypothetical protein